MFSALVFEREPPRLGDVPLAIMSWLQDKGGWAAFGLALWLLLGYTRMRPSEKARIPSWLSRSILGLIIISAAAYVSVGALLLLEWLRGDTGSTSPRSPTEVGLAVAGAAALLAVLLPILQNLFALRTRRIWGLTRLSFKEAIRSRVLYCFSAILLIVLFGSWFIPFKPEDQVRTYVQVIFWAMPFLLLSAAVIVAAFSIPTDIRKQTIHTIVTKPVERFEIFLGRFVGFTALMTLVLAIMTAVGLLYTLRGIDPAAAAESLKARDPLYGNLTFLDADDHQSEKGISVGREWGYRSYIARAMPGQPQQSAVWQFTEIPRALAGRGHVRCEFSLDIYRTTKGFENRGISCRFAFETAHFNQGGAQERKAREEEYRKEKEQLRGKGLGADQVEGELIRKFGYYEVPAFEIVDYHTQHIDIPGAVLDKALEPVNAPAFAGREPPPPLQVRVTVNSQSQYIGMAKYDLYLRQDDPDSTSDTVNFAVNFYKGAFGLWLRLCLLTGLAVALSTYLSGVISLILASVLYLCGNFLEFIQSLATGTAPEGGPIQSAVRLMRREVSVGSQDDSTVFRLAITSDLAFRWLFRRFMDFIPDIDRFDFTAYVAEGFNVSGMQLLLGAGIMVGYLLPWVILAYYLLRWREVASAT
jgi:ABC-type transport system involved in multi-copper enzyme maturation permease subunit